MKIHTRIDIYKHIYLINQKKKRRRAIQCFVLSFICSVHIDDVIADINGKLETKDVATEMEVFETEMEIKSSCINGKVCMEF